jgi:hypothetical protein
VKNFLFFLDFVEKAMRVACDVDSSDWEYRDTRNQVFKN